MSVCSPPMKEISVILPGTSGGFASTSHMVEVLEQQWPSVSRADSRAAVDQTLAILRRFLVAGHKVYLPGLGTLGTYQSLPRKGRNPRKPEVTIDIPAKTRVYFTAEKPLLKELNPV